MKGQEVILDTNIVIGYVKHEEAAIGKLEELVDVKKYILDITIDEACFKQEYQNQVMNYINEKCVIQKSLLPLTLSNIKKEQHWEWDSLFIGSDDRLTSIIDIVLDEYEQSIKKIQGVLTSLNRYDINIIINALYYNYQLITLDKQMNKKYNNIIKKLSCEVYN